MSQTDFTPSINLSRDFNRALDYIPTPNAHRIFNQIAKNFRRGVHAFNIIGSYGTGKSAFLVAFERTLRRAENHFEIDGHFNGFEKFRFRNIVGDFDSLIRTFAGYYEITDTASKSRVLEELNRDYQRAQQEGVLLVIVIDEFGKFLEYAAQNDPENELYFVQQLAEFVSDKNILLITTLHQSFDSYSRNLYRAQQLEWEKVKGRLKELPFNEPVEQLLHLAARHLDSYRERIQISDAYNLEALLRVIEDAGVFPLRTHLSEDFAQRLLPLDVLAAAILTLALQRYGQNERSLFSFLQSSDYLGITDDKARTGAYYSLSSVYDYLLHNFYSFLSTKYNPDYTQWAAIRRACERVEAVLEGNINTALMLVKAIGLLSIFCNEGARVNKAFLKNYGKIALESDDVEAIIDQLESHKIIRFVNFKNKYILFEGTDLDIDIAISRAADKIEPVENIVGQLKQYFHFPYFPAKAATYKFGTPRFFKVHLSDTLIEHTPAGEVDGFINLIFSENVTKQDVSEFSRKVDNCAAFVLYRNTARIRECLLEIRKVQYVIESIADDRVALSELRNILAHHIEELNNFVLRNLFCDDSQITWFFKGTEIDIHSRRDFNALLSKMCEHTYPATPVFRNELVNRHRPSSSVTIARKNFFEALLSQWDREDIGLDKDKFPPEKTIYYTLVKKTGIHRKGDCGYYLDSPMDPSFKELWQTSTTFLDSTKVSKKGLDEFVERLATKPFKLKQGFIELWLPLFLFIRRDDFALFKDDVYVPFITSEIIDLVIKKPRSFKLKAFNVAGVKLDLFNKYRTLLNKESTTAVSNASFIDTIRPFLTFYKELPDYTKRTQSLSKSARSLRQAIANATDPEETFFEQFPKALGYSDLQLRDGDGSLEHYFYQLQNAIRELRSCYDDLHNRVETNFLKELGYRDLGFAQYKAKIQERYQTLKQHLLLPYQKTFFLRLNSDLDERKAWINSLVHALMEKSLNSLRDEEEEILHERFVNIFRELDNLCDLTGVAFDKSKEEVVRIELTSFEEGNKKYILRLPKDGKHDADSLEQNLSKNLSKDKKLNVAVLSKLLKRELDDE